MHFCQQGKLNPTTYVVDCKLSHRHIRAVVDIFPRDNIALLCPLCNEHRRYRPSEVFLGFPSHMLAGQNSNVAQRRGVQRGIRAASFRRKD